MIESDVVVERFFLNSILLLRVSSRRVCMAQKWHCGAGGMEENQKRPLFSVDLCGAGGGAERKNKRRSSRSKGAWKTEAHAQTAHKQLWAHGGLKNRRLEEEV